MQESPFAKQDWHSDDFWVKGALSFRKHFVWKCATSIVERVCNEKKSSSANEKFTRLMQTRRSRVHGQFYPVFDRRVGSGLGLGLGL